MIIVRVHQRNARGQQVMLETLPGRMRSAIATGLQRGLLHAAQVSQREFLSGPRPGKIQSISGRLRGSITANVKQTDDRLIGRLGSNVKYAAFHEFGFHGVVNVRAHTRVIDQVALFGRGSGQFAASVDTRRRVVDENGNFVGFKESRKRAARTQKSGFVSVQFVKAHARDVNYPGKPFVRPAVEKSLPVILGEINKELKGLKLADIDEAFNEVKPNG